MDFVKYDSSKLTSFVLLLTAFGIITFNAMNLFADDNSKVCLQSNNISVQKIDDNHAKLHCDSIKTSNSDFLFSKSKISNGFQYDISIPDSSEKLYGFTSQTDVKFDEGIQGNSKLCAGVAGAVSGGGALAAVGAVGSVAGAATTISTAGNVGALVGTAAAGGAAAGLGLGTGAYVGLGLAAAALGPLALIGIAGTLVSVA